MPKVLATHHVLAVPDAETTARFFCDVLGFSRVPIGDPGWRFVELDGHWVMLGSCPDAIPPRDLGDHQYFGYFVVDSIDAYHRELVGRKCPLHGPPANKPWGMRELLVTTPDGHRLMFGERRG